MTSLRSPTTAITEASGWPSPPRTTDRPTGPTDPARRDRSDRTARFAWGAVAVILVGVIVLVIYALTRATTPQDVCTGRRSPRATSSPALASVPASVVRLGRDRYRRRRRSPHRYSSAGSRHWSRTGKPEVLFVGAEYCPFCAAERWPLIVALSRFGHFGALHNMQSAPLSVVLRHPDASASSGPPTPAAT